MNVIKSITKSGFVNFKRSGTISWAAVLVMTITLSVITTILLLQAVLYNSLEQIQQKVDVTIYFNGGAPEDKILALKSSLERLPEVAAVSYTSAEEALRTFRERHRDDYATIQALDEINENPLGAYLNVKAKEVSQYESIANFMESDDALVLSSDSIIRKVNYYQNKLVIDRLHSIIDGARTVGIIITAFLILVSAIITFNTIRLTIFISREEIGVMRLVGASKTRVQGPFLVEGAIYGIVATGITLVIFLPVTWWLGSQMREFFGMNIFQYYLDNFVRIIAIIGLSGIALGMISSFLAIRKYLNK